jgi:Flp pilus assembly secretin CpaC
MKPGIRELVVAATLLFTAIPGARAEDDAIALGVGTAFRLFLQKTYETVIVGDPLVVNVRTDDSRSVLIEPLKAGETNLVFVDAQGMVTANIKVSVCGASSSPACSTLHSSL